jgi:hypothetical protein
LHGWHLPILADAPKLLTADQITSVMPTAKRNLPCDQRREQAWRRSVVVRTALLLSSEIDTAAFQPHTGLPTKPIQRLELGFECFDSFNCAVGPFSLDCPVVVSVFYHEKYRFALKVIQGLHFMRATACCATKVAGDGLTPKPNNGP